MEKTELNKIGHDIGALEGRKFEYYEEERDKYIFFYFNEYSEYIEIPRSLIMRYKELDLEFLPVAC